MESTQPTILIVEDEPTLAEVLSDYLKASGFNTHIIGDGAQAIDGIKHHQPNLVILDLMLPNKNGLDIFKELRSFSDLPVIMATAKVEEIDRLLGLELGADDYICKPYSAREVVVRVKNILRRVHPSNSTTTEPAPLAINSDAMQAIYHGAELALTPAEFRLLKKLSHRPGVIFSRDKLMDAIYDDARVVTDRTIDSHIKNLRKKMLTVEPSHECIKSVYGVGYKFEQP
jgi:two-component system response regulator BaeR